MLLLRRFPAPKSYFFSTSFSTTKKGALRFLSILLACCFFFVGGTESIAHNHYLFFFFFFFFLTVFLLSLFFLFAAAEMDKCDDTGCKAPANWQKPGAKLPIMGDESIMKPKAHGTCATPLQDNLLWNVDAKVADEICTRFFRLVFLFFFRFVMICF